MCQPEFESLNCVVLAPVYKFIAVPERDFFRVLALRSSTAELRGLALRGMSLTALARSIGCGGACLVPSHRVQPQLDLSGQAVLTELRAVELPAVCTDLLDLCWMVPYPGRHLCQVAEIFFDSDVVESGDHKSGVPEFVFKWLQHNSRPNRKVAGEPESGANPAENEVA